MSNSLNYWFFSLNIYLTLGIHESLLRFSDGVGLWSSQAPPVCSESNHLFVTSLWQLLAATTCCEHDHIYLCFRPCLQHCCLSTVLISRLHPNSGSVSQSWKYLALDPCCCFSVLINCSGAVQEVAARWAGLLGPFCCWDHPASSLSWCSPATLIEWGKNKVKMAICQYRLLLGRVARYTVSCFG